jgi:hypothetical protein
VKIRTWKVGIAALALGASPALAETNGWSHDNNVSGVAFASDCCEPACGADSCCEDPCCEQVGCGDGCAAGLCSGGLLGATGLEGLSLAALLGAEGTGLDIGGWTEGVYMDNNVPLSQSYNDLRSFDDVPDHFHNGQTWFYIGQVADGSSGLGLGGRIDVLYGTDAQKTQAFGNPRANGAGGQRGTGTFDASLDHGEYGWAIPQAYGEIASGDLSVKVGHFFTPLGYEVIPVTGNFFRSHSYTMFNSEPFTHTGALATYTGFESLTLYGGWSAGWDTGFDQLNGGSNAIGGFTAQLADDVAFTYLSTYGNFGLIDNGGDNSYSHAMVLTVGLTDNLQYIAQSDNLRTDNTHTDSYGLNQYLIYKFNDVVSAGGRAEWWKADGISYNQVTGGFNFQLLSNLVIRPEIRQDWSPAGNIDEDTALVDAILTF